MAAATDGATAVDRTLVFLIYFCHKKNRDCYVVSVSLLEKPPPHPAGDLEIYYRHSSLHSAQRGFTFRHCLNLVLCHTTFPATSTASLQALGFK